MKYTLMMVPLSLPLGIPWDFINSDWNYAAMDANGEVVLYEQEPHISGEDNYWTTPLVSDWEKIVSILTINTTGIYWKDSLTKRVRNN